MPDLDLIIIPDPDEPEAAEVYIDGHIADGTGSARPYRFLLDTGAGRTSVISDDFLSTFAVVGQKNSSGVFAPTTDDLITIPSLAFGTITRENLTIARAAANELRSSLIGMDILKDHALHFVFDQARVTVDAVDRPAVSMQPIDFDAKFHPYIDVQTGSSRAQTVFDTGASLTVVNVAYIERNGGHFAPAGNSTGTDSTGASVQTPMFVMSGAVIGGHAFPPSRVAAVDLSHVNRTLEKPMDMILGYSTYRHARWWFDFPRGEWAITAKTLRHFG